MFRSSLAAAALWAGLAGGACAAGAQDDRAEFAGYVQICMEEHGKATKAVSDCVSDQVGALESYLGDILSETEGIVGGRNVPALRATQDAWEGYRDAACAYHAGLDRGDAGRRSQFCRLRLVRERIEEILQGEGFADPEAKPE
jgi:uncharacterized protein YecT (DUF1311 family)